MIINGRRYIGGVEPPYVPQYKDYTADDMYRRCGILRGSYESISWRNRYGANHYRRDYTQYFLDWYAKRYNVYISDSFVEKVIDRHKKKFGQYSLAKNEADAHWLNYKYCDHTPEIFTPVILGKNKPAEPVYCVCGELISAKYIKPDGKNLTHLEDSWYDEFDGGLQDRVDSCYMRFELIQPSYPETCGHTRCNQVMRYLKKDPDVLQDYKKLKIRANIPTKDILNKQHPEYKGTFVLARYLDFRARYIDGSENKQ